MIISKISEGCRKDLAFVLFVVLGIQTVLPVHGYASGTVTNSPKSKGFAGYFAPLMLPQIAITDESKSIRKNEVNSHVSVLNGGLEEEVFDEYIDGPGQPEMRQFSPVGTNNMVDLFSGNFSYNIPLLDVGGYPVNISYTGDISMDQEASWVGLGWNINPGAVNRNLRGIPDDFNGTDKIITTNRIKPTTIAGGSLGAGFEFSGINLNLNLSVGAFYHSRNGWGTEIGINPSINLAGQSGGDKTGGDNTKGGSDSSGPSGPSAGINLNFNSQEGLSISPSFSYQFKKNSDNDQGSASISTNYNSRQGLTALTVGASFLDRARKMKEPADISGGISFVRPTAIPTISMPFTTKNVTFNLGVGGEITVGHVKGNLNGYYTRSLIKENDQTQRKASYGYMYFTAGQKDKNGLMDVSRDKETGYRDKPLMQNIAIPTYSYDAFSFSGEGNSGTFRAYRGDVGYGFDHYMRTKSESFSGGLDIGVGGGVKVGGNFSYARTTITNSNWKMLNGALKNLAFTDKSGYHEPVYFRSAAELTVARQAYTDKIGGDKLVKLSMSRVGGNQSPVFGINPKLDLYNNQVVRTGQLSLGDSAISNGQERERRNQAISYLTADEAVVAGDPYIVSYDTNYFRSGCNIDSGRVHYLPRFDTNSTSSGSVVSKIYGMKKAHHLSLIKMVNNEGKRYEYGIPVYNVENKEVTYSLRKYGTVNSQNNLAYSEATTEIDNVTKEHLGYKLKDEEDKGTDNYFLRRITPAYSHSFLLTGIYSPDYMDVTDDGPTEDDLGDAVKFNYSRVYTNSTPYKWRSPMHPVSGANLLDRVDTLPGPGGTYIYNPVYKWIDSANGNYNEGLKTDYRDDKVSYTAGSKEVWYLNSIESNTMIATFWVGQRRDAPSQVNELGGNDTSRQLCYLKEIRLYAKTDLAKNGLNGAKPVKTVHFDYDYSLCPNYPMNTGGASGSGKLTLRKIWFTYNKNEKGQQNPYKFYYRNNQPYQYQASDNWGSYKDLSDNPGGLSSADYPYPVNNAQNAAGKENNIAAWALDSLVLPSGSNIKVTYENDSYGFVQNKRAQQLFQIYKLGKTSSLAGADNRLYEDKNDDNDHRYVFVKVPYSVNTKKALFKRYLEGINYLYFRLKVKMPDDPLFDIYGKQYEFVKLYTKIDKDNYGIADAANNIIWFKLEGTARKSSRDEKYSPLTKSAIQFLRTDVPMKAYPGSAFPTDQPLSLTTFASALVGSFGEVSTLFKGFHGKQKSKSACKYIDLDGSFVRLNSPTLSKQGGGSRVKKIVIRDNWNAMTGQKESMYGQEYIYTTKHNINGKDTIISSGVASYEPFLGGEENPFKFPVENYNEQSALLGPVNTLYVEGPLMESMYPGASVGYRKVTVRSINNTNVKSLTGTDVTCFYTSYEYPVIEKNTPIGDGYFKFNTPTSMLNPFKCIAIKKYAFSQGFKIELNDMNGKMRSQASYSAFDGNRPLSSSEYFYKSVALDANSRKLDNTVTTIDTAGHISSSQLGRDIEVFTDFRQQESRMFSGGVNSNFHFFTIGIFPLLIPAFLKMPQSDLKVYQAAAVTKVVNRHAIVDSVVVIDKGSKVSTENLAYDVETGEVLVTRTRNEYDDPIYNVNLPAHWAYDRMGQAYKNLDVAFSNVDFTSGIISNQSVNEPYFTPGDEVIAYKKRNRDHPKFWYNTKKLFVVKAKDYQTYPDKAYADPVSGVPGYPPASGYSDLRFVDEAGKLFSDTTYEIKIVRSGRRNVPQAPVGSLTLLNNPIVAGNLKLSGLTNVINASAVEYKEDFKMASYYWITDSCNRVCDCDSGYTYNKALKLCIKEVAPALPATTMKFRDYSVWNQFGVEIYNDNYKKLLDFQHSPCAPGCSEHEAEARYQDPEYNRYAASSYIKSRGVFCHQYDNFWTGVPGGLPYPGGGPGRLKTTVLTLSNMAGTADTLIEGTTGPMKSAGIEYNMYSPTDRIYYVGIGGGYFYTAVMDCDTIFQRIGETQWVDYYGGALKNFWHVFPVKVTKGLHKFLFYGGHGPTHFKGGFGAEIYDNTKEELISDSLGNKLRIVFSTKDYKNAPAYFIDEEPAPISYPEDTPDCTDCVPILAKNRPYCANTELDKVNFISKPPTNCVSSIPEIEELPYINPYKLGILGNYRPYRSYIFYRNRKEQTVSSSVTNIRQYGALDTFYAFWNYTGGWLKPTYQADWKWNSENTLFSRRGAGIETKDPLNRYTAGQYGYAQTLPVAVTQNSKYRESAFDGFEDYSYYADACSVLDTCQKRVKRHIDWSHFKSRIQTSVVHTGRYAIAITDTDSAYTETALDSIASDIKPIWLRAQQTTDPKGVITDASSKMPVFAPTYGDSAIVSCWIKENVACDSTGSYTHSKVNIYFLSATNTLQSSYNLIPSGPIIDGWQRMEAMIKIPSSNTKKMRIALVGTSGYTSYFDDIRLHPYHANMKSFVYDPISLRLMAELDENNFASLYEYDDDGTLVRVKKETEQGIKTIKETRSAYLKNQ